MSVEAKALHSYTKVLNKILTYGYDSGLRLQSLYTRLITYIYNNTQTKIATLIIITLNTLSMKHKSKVIIIIVYS